jgi:hypothetical protein
MRAMFSRLWERWKGLAKKIGEFQSRVILGGFYFVIVCPFAMVVQWTSDPLVIKSKSPKGWQQRSQSRTVSIESARRQS